MEARLEVSTVEERQRAISGRADALGRGRGGRAPGRRPCDGQGPAPGRGRAVASAVAEGARIALRRIEDSSAAADAERQAAEEAHKGRDGELKAVRARIRDTSEELEKVVDSAHGAQMARATRQLQLEQIAARALEEFATEADVLVAEYGPEVPVPGADEGQLAVPYDREEQEQRAQHGAAAARPARQSQPAGAGGVRGAGGAARVPGRPAGGPEEDPPGPADRDQGSRRAGPAGLQRRLRRRRARVRGRSSPGCSPVATAGWC